MARPAAAPVAALTLAHIVAALIFCRGFLLTRVELPDTSACPGPGCLAPGISDHIADHGGSPAVTYDRAVILIVDALRFDFVCEPATAQKQFAGAFPRTLALVGGGGEGATTLRFVADTPTITMSRLKALLTGGLPTFLDVGSSFSASQVTEDNLLSQLKAAGKRIAFVGDDTWQQLAPSALEWSWPYPSFNVKDLHTVDDGVWQHVLPLLRGVSPDSLAAANRSAAADTSDSANSSSSSGDSSSKGDSSSAKSQEGDRTWDILIGHYLGVDHAGHSHGVGGAPMATKLAQMDAQVSTVIELMTDGAGPGGPFERTLLLILSDHGQTLGGDHGGGAPDETDSVLIAVSPAKLHTTRQQQQQRWQQRQQQQGVLAGEQEGQEGRGAATAGQALSVEQLDRLQTALLSEGWAAGGDSSSSSSSDSSGSFSHPPPPQTPQTCGGTIPQIDLTPTLALLLGVPIPYGNLGKIPAALWHVLAAAPAAGSGAGGPTAGDNAQQRSAAAAAAAAAAASVHGGGGGGGQGYAAALAANAAQVHRYLNRYAAVAKLPSRALARCNQLFAAAVATAEAAAAAATGSSVEGQLAATGTAAGKGAGGRGEEEKEEAVVAAWTAFLDAAAALARAQFTRFDPLFIWAGVAAAAGAAGLHLWLCWRMFQPATPHSKGSSSSSSSSSGGSAWSPDVWILAALEGAHALSLFSVGALMGEGRLACGLVDAATLLLAWSALTALNRACSGSSSMISAPQRVRNGTAAAGKQQQPPSVQLVVALAASLLAINHLLQRLGLIDRYGQDPHDKTEPSGELLGPTGGGAGLLALHLAATAGAALGAWLLWAAAAARLRRRERTEWRVARGGAVAMEVLAAGAKVAAGVEAAAIAAFWWAQLTGHGNAAAGDVARSILAAVAPKAPLFLPPPLLPQAVLEVAAPLATLPLRLLLPRVVYSLALLTLAAALLLAVASRLATFGSKPTPAQTPPAAPRAALWVLAAASGPVAMALGYKGPAIITLGWAQAAAAAGLLSARAAARRTTSSGNHRQPLVERQSGLATDRTAAGADDDSAPLVALLLGMQALQLFFCSGHFCEFSGLQYASSFIGFDDMVPAVSGPLLLVNTLGPMMLACLGLPLAVWVCEAGHSTRQASLGNGGSGDSSSGDGTPAAGQAAVPAAAAGARSSGGSSVAAGEAGESWATAADAARRATGALLLFGGVRAAALAVCIASAAVQQGHILLWAIFAPKLVFEMWMCAVADVFLLLAAWLWLG